ncbi:MAG: hypothetical protein M0Z59_09400 [Nitrospiraceae bacterium]|nr:hypothetical protein [Nitrospiraceae bacterium]
MSIPYRCSRCASNSPISYYQSEIQDHINLNHPGEPGVYVQSGMISCSYCALGPFSDTGSFDSHNHAMHDGNAKGDPVFPYG